MLELERSEFNDWLAAARAVDLDKKLIDMNVSLYPYKNERNRSSDWARVKNEQLIALGENPYLADQDAIERTRKKRLNSGKVKKIGNSKRNPGKTKT